MTMTHGRYCNYMTNHTSYCGYMANICSQLACSQTESLINRLAKRNVKAFITKTCLYYFDPLKPYFYILKLGFTGVYIIFFISAQKHSLWVLVRTASPRRF